MDPITIITVTSAALTLIENLIPKIREMAQNGEITPEQQQEVLTKYKRLRDQPDEAFSGNQWNKSDGTPSRSQTGE